ncbi:MAG: biotin--[acetyl-CoA-carboxylase] ligase [Helicobacter sp.]|nr:biotin--[acetyl-CoA-carboxylase] ligase [Helicobacteraceae bacterium]MDY3112732.1 biotin--[acetyl-CoA-carboxylase] ligase [Helicobacter sp.]
MQILKFNELPSTHLFLSQKLRTQELKSPIVVVADRQSGGIGSRGNSWDSVEDGLYFSFSLNVANLPDDLPIESTSIYMGFIFKEVLNVYKANVWLKWPNDLYVDNKKVGGILCTKIRNDILVGIGVNFKVSNEAFGAIEVDISKEAILNDFIEKIKFIKKTISWKQIFSKYSLEFSNNFNYSFNHQGKIISLANALLCNDGAIMINKEKIYSLR